MKKRGKAVKKWIIGLVAAALALATPTYARPLNEDTKLICLPDKADKAVKLLQIRLRFEKDNTDNYKTFHLTITHVGWNGTLWDRFTQYDNVDLRQHEEKPMWFWEGIQKTPPHQKMVGVLGIGSDERFHYMENIFVAGKQPENALVFKYSLCIEDLEAK